MTISTDRTKVHTTGNAAFAVRSNLCRVSFIGRTAKKLSVVRRTKRTANNLYHASYFLTHGKESLPCVLISGARQRFFSFLHFCNKWPLVFAVRFNFRRTAKIFPSSTFSINGR
jgi:hypothetical protein